MPAMGMGRYFFFDKPPELIADKIQCLVFQSGFAKATGIKTVFDFSGNGAARSVRITVG